MSTCRGLPAPHDRCPHGAACDWEPLPQDGKACERPRRYDVVQLPQDHSTCAHALGVCRPVTLWP